MFYPYHIWLGIPPKEQPPNHYRLLGSQPFESDAEVIDSAANRQMTYVQQMAIGEYMAPSQKLLNELSAARLCLLDLKKKADYDLQLRLNLKHPSEEKPQRHLSKPKPTPFAHLEPTEPNRGITIRPKMVESLSTSIKSVEDNTVLQTRQRVHKIIYVLGGCFILVLVLFLVLGRDKNTKDLSEIAVSGGQNPSHTGEKRPDEVKMLINQ